MRKFMSAIVPWVKRHTTLILLFMVNLLNYCDRYTLAATLTTLQNATKTGWSHDLDDTESGLLQTVFIIALAVCAPPVGFLADRYNRVIVVTVGVSVWIVATLACSFATSYTFFIVFRSLVGVGEGTYTVIAPVLLADLYAMEDRVTILTIFYLAIPIGTAGGYELGQAVTQTLGWRWAFRITPAIGAILVILFAIVARDPGRGPQALEKSTSSVWSDLVQILKVKTYVLCALGSTCATFVTGALGFLGPTLFARAAASDDDGRVDDDKKSRSVFILGVLVGVGGIASSIMAIALSKCLANKTARGDALISATGMLLAVPAGLAFIGVIKSSITLSYVFAFVVVLGCLLCIPLLTSMTIAVLMPTVRSFGQGIMQVFAHAFGDAASPLLIGILSDNLHKNYGYSKLDGLRWALESCVVSCVLGAAAFYAASVVYPKEKEAVDFAIADNGGYGAYYDVADDLEDKLDSAPLLQHPPAHALENSGGYELHADAAVDPDSAASNILSVTSSMRYGSVE